MSIEAPCRVCSDEYCVCLLEFFDPGRGSMQPETSKNCLPSHLVLGLGREGIFF